MNGRPSTNNQMGVSDLELTTTQEIILRLKAIKSENELTLPRIMDMVEKNGDYISMSTLRRVFAPNSEEDGSFSYDRTIAPIARALLLQDIDPQDENIKGAAVEIDGLKAVIRHKNEENDLLKDQIEELKKQIGDIRAEYDLRLRFLRDQIELKDKRMDEKDKIINRLMEKCL